MGEGMEKERGRLEDPINVKEEGKIVQYYKV